jgi:hypothetical protein
MLTVRLGRLGKGRVWLDDMPDMAYDAARVEECSTAAGPGKALRPHAAVEMFLPRGPVAMYGALGVMFTPGAGNGLMIHVGAADVGMDLCKDALAAAIDEVRTGLLPEFVDAALKGLLAGAEAVGHGAGVLMVTHAACGRIGSNSWIFERLGRAAVIALTTPAETDWETAFTPLLK